MADKNNPMGFNHTDAAASIHSSVTGEGGGYYGGGQNRAGDPPGAAGTLPVGQSQPETPMSQIKKGYVIPKPRQGPPGPGGSDYPNGYPADGTPPGGSVMHPAVLEAWHYNGYMNRERTAPEGDNGVLDRARAHISNLPPGTVTHPRVGDQPPMTSTREADLDAFDTNHPKGDLTTVNDFGPTLTGGQPEEVGSVPGYMNADQAVNALNKSPGSNMAPKQRKP